MAIMMDDVNRSDANDLAARIARLVEERGWNQSAFARIAGLNLHTIRQILLSPDADRRLRNATVSKCARALGLTVNELRTQPLERLIARVHNPRPADEAPSQRRLYEEATQPELLDWLERNPDRAKQLTEEEIEELLSLQGTGGPLTLIGVEHFVSVVERKRNLMEKVQAVAGTEYLDFLEQFVDLLYDKVQPYANRR
jgi:transcriptional regulator with XRE-family HTH domain